MIQAQIFSALNGGYLFVRNTLLSSLVHIYHISSELFAECESLLVRKFGESNTSLEGNCYHPVTVGYFYIGRSAAIGKWKLHRASQ